MKASETDFRFPLFAFAKSGEHSGYTNLDSLQWSYRKHHFEDGLYSDMELIDADCRRWLVRDAYMIATPEPRRWWHIGFIKPHVWKSLELEVEEIEAVSFTTLFDRVWSCHIEDRQRLIDMGMGHRAESEEDLEYTLSDLQPATNAEALFYADNLDAAPGFND